MLYWHKNLNKEKEKKMNNNVKAKPIARKGRKPRVSDLPLVAYSLSCGHLGRQYGIQKKDRVFCKDCGSDKYVARIIAQ